MPNFDDTKTAFRSSDAQLLDRHGEPIQSLRIDMSVRRKQWVALDDISPALQQAVLQAEDQRFHEHGGVDLRALGKAAWDNLFRERARGASTISMQVAALLDEQLRAPRGGRSIGQKWDQMQAARELEAAWSKPQILEAYLNLLSFRGELQGIGAASQVLFAKAPSGLNHAESLILASLIRAPNAPVKVVARRACALAQESELSTPCSAIEAATTRALMRTHGAPHHALDTPASQVARKLLKSAAQDAPSTLDANLQRAALDTLRRHLAALADRNVNDGAVLVLDNASGDILAYVANDGDSSVDGVAALRQAGSTLKPFLYQLAIERKLLTAASVLDDTPVDISTPTGLYIPQNYDRNFKGHVSVRTSLGSSLNVPTVRTLVMIGLDPFYKRLKELGFASLTESADYYGYSLALGSADVSLLELANAYRTLANGGMAGPLRLAPEESLPAKRRVLDARASFVVADMLADRAARSLTFGLHSELATPFWSAVKTGTSKDMRDNWCIGFSEKYTVAVWVGNFDGAPMWDVSGISGAAPVWREVMDYLHANVPSRAPAAPPGVVTRQIAYRPALEAARSEWFLAGTEREIVEVVSSDKRAPKIRYPGAGTLIAIDPDIPAASQHIYFQAQAGTGLKWRLNGSELGSANADLPWQAVAGAHELALVDDSGKAVDAVRFEVR